MAKDDGAFLTIGELAQQLGVAQHILRYWETRFPQLRPLQRSGNRRYYRPRDVDVARQINRLLNEEGFTVRGAQRVLAGRKEAAGDGHVDPLPAPASQHVLPATPEPAVHSGMSSQGELAIEDRPAEAAPASEAKADVGPSDLALLIARLTVIRQNLVDALDPQ